MKLEGTFYGINNFNLFKYICHKVKQNSKYFILISSGSSWEKIFEYCRNINIAQIYRCYIYCFSKDKYLPQMKICPKLKGVFSSFDDLKKELFTNQNKLIKNIPIKSSNLIFLSDYNSTYIKLHFEIVRKYSLYKLLKLNNFNQSKFMTLVKNKCPYYLKMANEIIYNDDEAMIQFFKNKTKEPETNLRRYFNNDHTVQHYISNYTLEGFYYRYINKFLREGDFNSFRLLSNHISKFVYKLYEYRKTNFQICNSTLYRYMYITTNEFQIYLNSIGKVICYPSFTSTSLKENSFCPFICNTNTIKVKLVIKQNNSKSIICIRDLSQHPDEEEYLCLPFSFFKITNIAQDNGNNIIYLTALNSEKPIEEMFLEFMENETDNLDPEGLQMLRLTNDDNTIVLNMHLYRNFYSNYTFSF